MSPGQKSGWKVNSRIRPIVTAAAKKKSVSEVVRGKSKARITRFTVNSPRNSVPMPAATWFSGPRGLPRKCVQMAATIASRKVGYKKTILG